MIDCAACQDMPCLLVFQPHGNIKALMLLQVPGRTPLALATIKGFTGHQEAASGVANLLAAAITAGMARMPPAVHLRTLNPLVAGALAGQPTCIARGGPAGMPAPNAGSTGSMQMGVNAFGAQGTNAHAIIAAGAAFAVTQAPAAAANAGRLRMKRCWITPPMQVCSSGGFNSKLLFSM